MTHPHSRAACLASIMSLVFLAIPATGVAQQAQPVKVHPQFTITTTDSAGNAITVEIPDSTTDVQTHSFDTVKVRQNWSKLQKGFSHADVEKLLGVPPKVRYDETYEYWWYGNRAVIFNAVTHKVSGWDE